MLTGEVKIEVPKRADAAIGEWNLPRHALDETRVNEQLATFNLTDAAPGQAVPPNSFWSEVDTNTDVTDSDACTAGPRGFESDEEAGRPWVLAEPPSSPVVEDEVESLGYGSRGHLARVWPHAHVQLADHPSPRRTADAASSVGRRRGTKGMARLADQEHALLVSPTVL